MIRRPPRSTPLYSSAASDVYKRQHKVQLSLEEIILIFNDSFSFRYTIRIEGGANELIYLPSNSDCKTNRLIFRNNYISSALHEVANWCLAGDERR